MALTAFSNNLIVWSPLRKLPPFYEILDPPLDFGNILKLKFPRWPTVVFGSALLNYGTAYPPICVIAPAVRNFFPTAWTIYCDSLLRLSRIACHVCLRDLIFVVCVADPAHGKP